MWNHIIMFIFEFWLAVSHLIVLLIFDSCDNFLPCLIFTGLTKIETIFHPYVRRQRGYLTRLIWQLLLFFLVKCDGLLGY